MKADYLLIAAVGIMMLGSCKQKQAPTDIIVAREEVRKPQAPIRMQDYRQEQNVKWNGKDYIVVVERTPADSLPMVEDEIGQKFVDNKIALTIRRSDGSLFFSRNFTKNAFAAYLNDDYRSTGILEAMIFDEVDDGLLEFAVSVAHPQSEDEFIPLEVKIGPDGSISIKRDSDIDVNGEQASSPDDE